MSAQSLGFVLLGEGDTSRAVRYDKFVEALFKVDTHIQMVNHAALGVCGEAGELADCLKKHIHYGKPVNFDNLVEELGDLRFYLQAVQNIFGITEQHILQKNAEKLAVRYAGLMYSDDAAIARADKLPVAAPSPSTCEKGKES